MNYPEELIRGISSLSSDFVEYCEGEFIAKAGLFQFEDTGREDKLLEVSINWYDDIGALKLIIEKKKANEEIQYKGGAAFLLREKIDREFVKYVSLKKVSYERDVKDDNKYHGNILVSKDIKPLIAGLLAHLVNRIQKEIVEK